MSKLCTLVDILQDTSLCHQHGMRLSLLSKEAHLLSGDRYEAEQARIMQTPVDLQGNFLTTGAIEKSLLRTVLKTVGLQPRY